MKQRPRIKQLLSSFSVVMLLSSLLLVPVVGAEGTNPLNGVGTPKGNNTATTGNSNQGGESSNLENSEYGTSADAIGSLWSNVGVDSEATAKANTYLEPLAKIGNMAFAIIIGFTAVAIFVLTGVDLMYIGVPPVRRFLAPEAQSSGGGMSGGFGGGGFGGGGFGGGGFGGGYGAMGGGTQSKPSGLGRWISDEAMSAVSASEPQSSGGGFGGGFGGQQEAPKSGSVILSYLKKRIIFLVAFGVCVILLGTTIFTDMGVSLGMWILEKLTGLFG